MKRPALATRLWRKLFPARKVVATKPPQPVRRPVSSLEPLEGRIAPATLISATTMSYQDLDGDTVTVKFSKPIFDLSSPALGNSQANAIFSFTGGTGVNGSNATPQALDLLDLTKAPFTSGGNVAAGISFTITAKTVGGGASTVDIGKVKADGLALGAVRIDGALTEIDCGSNSVAVGLKSLTLNSLNSVAGGAKSEIIGALGSLKVKNDVSQAHLQVVSGASVLGKVTAIGKIGSISIGGSLVGKVGDTVVSGTNYANWGLIEAAAGIGSVKIGTTSQQGIKGGFGTNSGAIVSGGDIGPVTISGSIAGSTGVKSGTIQAAGKVGAIELFDLQGGDGANSGSISGGAIQSVSLHSILGGKGAESGVLKSETTMGQVKLSGNIDARIVGVGVGAGGITAGGDLGSVQIDGSIFGGAAKFSGFIEGAANVGKIEVGGSITGGTAASTGVVSIAGSISSLMAGSLVGGAEANSGSVFTGTNPFLTGEIGKVKIGTALSGGAGANSGSIITAHGEIGSITIGTPGATSGGLNGGAGSFSGAIYADGTIGKVKIAGNLTGGAGADSGSIHSFGKLTKITVSGSLVGGGGDGSASIFSHDDLTNGLAGDIGAVVIGGSVRGLAADGGDNAAQIHAQGSLGKAKINALGGGSGSKAGSIVVGDGAMNSGSGAIKLQSFDTTLGGGDGSIEVHGRLASLAVAGTVRGATIHVGDDLSAFSAGSLAETIITARGEAEQGRTTDLAIGKVTVRGSVTGSRILAGFSLTGDPVNADAQIGAVKVGGAWTASDLVAGVIDVDGDGFGNADDRKAPGSDNIAIVSRIASITVSGAVTGTPDATSADDHFGFVAQEIGSFKANGTARQFTKNITDQPVQLATDVAIREIPLTSAT